jgi:hypothetical protein
LNLKQGKVKHLGFKCLKGYSQSYILQFVDGENCDPYRLAAMFDSLKGYEIQKIDKVVDFAFQSTPQCKVRNSSYEFAVISKNKILRDF